MSKKITRRKFINKTGSAALAGALVSQFGYNFALAANKDPAAEANQPNADNDLADMMKI